MSFNLGFIGGGNMSTAIVRGVLNSDAHPASKIWVSGPHIHNLKHWSDMGTNVTDKNSEVFSTCDVVFLGVKPGMLVEVVRSCSSGLSKHLGKKTFISMLAGVSIEELHKELIVLSPYADIGVIRIMPNTPMTVGVGVCLFTPDLNVAEDQCILTEKLLSGSALCERVPEPMMDSLGVLTACGPAFMYMVIEALADGAVKQGVPRAMAQRNAAQMVAGSGQMVLQSGKHPGQLKDEVCSPGGSTICGVTELENGKLRATMISAIEASTRRTKELGKK